MSIAENELADDLPLEITAVLWADAYRLALRPALERRLSTEELSRLDQAVDRIERGVFKDSARQAICA